MTQSLLQTTLDVFERYQRARSTLCFPYLGEVEFWLFRDIILPVFFYEEGLGRSSTKLIYHSHSLLSNLRGTQ